VLVVRPEALRILGATGARNTVTATVLETRFRGTHRTVVAVTGGTTLTVAVAPAVPVEPGDRVHLQLPPAALPVVPGATAGPTPSPPPRTRKPVRELRLDIPLDGIVLTDATTGDPVELARWPACSC
jgi:hypothetical protein